MIQYQRQFCKKLIIVFPFIKRSFVGIFDTCYTILVGYTEIFPKGSYQVIADFLHKFLKCHILTI